MNQSVTAAASALYRQVSDAPPNAVIALSGDQALVETNEAGREACPSGYKEVLLRRTPSGWQVYPVAERGLCSDALEAVVEMRSRQRHPIRALPDSAAGLRPGTAARIAIRGNANAAS